MTRRSGLTTIAFVMILMVAIAIAGTSIFLSRSANRSTMWFLLAQRSQDLASTGLKVVLARMQELGGGPPQPPGDGVSRCLEAMRGEKAPDPDQVYRLLDRDTLTAWSEELATQLAAWSDGKPDVTVTARIVESADLWTGKLGGVLPADPHERHGVLQITSTAAVQGRDGRRVGRTLVLERDFETVTLRLPLLGRFALFCGGGPDADPNFVKLQFQADGDGALQPGSPHPLVVHSRTVELTRGSTLSGQLAQDLSARCLDEAGWVYLGVGDAAASDWTLRMPHGYGKHGESPLLPGAGGLIAGESTPQFCHGLAKGEEQIGAAVAGALRAAPATPPADELATSGLRLFGTPVAFSPTLVFGRVDRRYRARTLSAAAAPDAEKTDWYLAGLEQALASQGDRAYGSDGVLAPASAARTPLELQSRVARVTPWLSSGGRETPPADVHDGRLEVPGLYGGDLAGGLAAFRTAMDRKTVYAMKAEKALAFLAKAPVHLPGILRVTATGKSGLTLSNLEVAGGGIVLVEGGITLDGDVHRSGDQAPLALVALEGDIRLGPHASHVDAHLVALKGEVTWPAGALVVNGGIAAQSLGVKSLRLAAEDHEIAFDGLADPLAPNAEASYRVLFGGDDRLSVSGVEEP